MGVEKIVEEALSSIGGQDDTLASFLSSINTNAHKTAQNYDKKKKKAAEIYDKLENTRQLEVKKQEKKEKARAVKQASIKQRKEKDIFAKIKEEKEKEIMPLFNGQHGLFDFNFNDGTYSWRFFFFLFVIALRTPGRNGFCLLSDCTNTKLVRVPRSFCTGAAVRAPPSFKSHCTIHTSP